MTPAQEPARAPSPRGGHRPSRESGGDFARARAWRSAPSAPPELASPYPLHRPPNASVHTFRYASAQYAVRYRTTVTSNNMRHRASNPTNPLWTFSQLTLSALLTGGSVGEGNVGSFARVAKLADALDLGSSVFGRGGSSPPSRTKTARHPLGGPGRFDVVEAASGQRPRARRASRARRPCRAPQRRRRAGSARAPAVLPPG